jgi:hypothetical protein
MAGFDLHQVEQLLATPEPPELGPGPREGVQPEADLNRKLDELLNSTKLSNEKQQLIRALVLLWHDHLDAAHVIAQSIENPDGAFVHGIMHRRERDYGNAAYWFRRVGKHPAFPEIRKRVKALTAAKGEGEVGKDLIPQGEWNAFAFIDACEQGSRQGASEQQSRLLREVQAVETRVLLEWFCR